MHLIGEFHPPSSKGHRYALIVICMLTGYTFCIPLKTKTAAEVVKVYVDNVYAKFEGSLKILSDNGTKFKNQLFTDVATELGVEYKIYTPAYHPQSNGQIQGFHNFLKACISKLISPTMEWDDVVPLACATYNFLPNEHFKESPFSLMFGREARILLNTMFQSQIRYLGNDENILSIQALKNMYQLVAENLQKARKRMAAANFPQTTKLKTEDSVMNKNHTAGPFEPVYKGNYHMVAIKVNQDEVVPAEGGKSQMLHITDVKYILPADNIIAKLSDYNKFGCKTKLRLNPQNVPDLDWELATTANTEPTPPTTTINYTLPMSTDKITTTSTPVMISVKADKP